MSWLSDDDKTPDHSSISGGAGNDSIDNKGLHVTISGGDAGNDFIDNRGAHSTILGGSGSDTISLSSSASLNLIEYALGDGDDSIYGFKATDTLSITGGTYFTQVSGSELVVSG